jgi:hypothetical protein
VVEADVFVITAKSVTSVQTVTANVVPLQEDRDMLLDYDRLWYRDCKGLRYRNSHRLRDVHRDGHRIRNLNRYFHWVRDRPLYSVRYWLLYRDGIRLRDVNGVRPIYRNCNWNLHRDRYMLFDCDWVRLWHRYGDFFSDGDCLDISFVGQTDTSAQAVAALAVAAKAVAAQAVPADSVVQFAVSVP